ncbi:MAG: hypothetical protein WDW38_010915 [Sanguina aurantia]
MRASLRQQPRQGSSLRLSHQDSSGSRTVRLHPHGTATCFPRTPLPVRTAVRNSSQTCSAAPRAAAAAAAGAAAAARPQSQPLPGPAPSHRRASSQPRSGTACGASGSGTPAGPPGPEPPAADASTPTSSALASWCQSFLRVWAHSPQGGRWTAAAAAAKRAVMLLAFACALFLVSLVPRPRPVHATSSSLPGTHCARVCEPHARSGAAPDQRPSSCTSGDTPAPHPTPSSQSRQQPPVGAAARLPRSGAFRHHTGRQTAAPNPIYGCAAAPSKAQQAQQQEHTQTSSLHAAPGAGNHPSSPPPSQAGPSASMSSPPAVTSTQPAAAATAAAAGSTAPAAAVWDLGSNELATAALFQRALPSVVNITHMRAMANFQTLDVHRMPYGQGSGVIWDARGHVVTNYHIIKGASEVKVTMYDHTTYTAKLVGVDAAKDIAVLKLSMPKSKLRDLVPISMGTSGNLVVGQSVFAIGNPFGLDHTLNTGVVSGVGRELNAGLFPIRDCIQTDAAINPGNSGGVLLDSKGQLVGINTAAGGIFEAGTFDGIGMAVPVDTVKGMVNQILQYGRVVRPTLGVTLAPPQVLAVSGTPGVLVMEVPSGSPAHSAGLRPTHRDIFGDIVLGDIIIGVDGKSVRSSHELYTVLESKRVGDRVRVDIVRDSKSTSLTLTLGERLLGVVEE